MDAIFIVCLILIGIVSLGILFSLFLLYRNEAVFNERTRIGNLISTQAQKEIDSGQFDNWRKWYDRKSEVTYDTMLLHFWQPIKSFYADLEEDIKNEK